MTKSVHFATRKGHFQPKLYRSRKKDVMQVGEWWLLAGLSLGKMLTGYLTKTFWNIAL